VVEQPAPVRVEQELGVDAFEQVDGPHGLGLLARSAGLEGRGVHSEPAVLIGQPGW
jgi:hypothetical protein